jgi:hypothetical protein
MSSSDQLEEKIAQPLKAEATEVNITGTVKV